MPPSDKRQRQKENTRLAREAREAALRRQRQRKMAFRVGIFVVLFGIVVALFAVLGGNDDNNTATSTTTASTTVTTAAPLADAKGKPCVAMKGTPPKGAPTVPVQVGAPPKTLIEKDLKVGTGAVVQPGATITANYIGVACSTGKIFDSSWSRGQPASFSLTQVIKGWTDGIPGMRVGGRRLLGIPAAQAYGASGRPPDIGPNEPLWFVVDIVKVEASTTASTPTPSS